MSIENEVFEGAHFNIQKGLDFGFIQEEDTYTYSTYFMDDTFQAILTIKEGSIHGKVIEVEFEEEYINLRIESIKGEFIGKVREAYFELLYHIKLACFDMSLFHSPQANRLASYIQAKYNIECDNPFQEQGHMVFRDQKSQKWFGLVSYLSGKRFGKEGKIEILNVKMDPEEISKYLELPGFYPAYHMDKKNWITIVLDESVEDSILYSCVDASYNLVHARQYWIVPANPKYYDIFSHFETQEEITWKQTTKVNVDDILYIYVTQPYRCIYYKCLVTQVDIPYSYADDHLKMKKVMKCKLLHTYKENEISMDLLSRIGIPNIRCTRKIHPKLVKEFDND